MQARGCAQHTQHPVFNKKNNYQYVPLPDGRAAFPAKAADLPSRPGCQQRSRQRTGRTAFFPTPVPAPSGPAARVARPVGPFLCRGPLALLMHLPAQAYGQSGQNLHDLQRPEQTMTPHEMLDALSRRTGAALSFNRDGLCRLRFDGRFIVDLEVADDEDAIWLYARLGPLPAGGAGQGADGADDAGPLPGPGKRQHAFRPGRRRIHGLCPRGGGRAGEDTLFTALEDFLDVLAHWADELQQGRWPAP